MKENEKYTNLLRSLIEQTIGRRVMRPRDFEYLSMCISSNTGTRISVSTLKRFWGYVSGGGSWRKDTLDTLCVIIGYINWDAFVKHANSMSPEEVESNVVMCGRITSTELEAGDMLRVQWLPNRVCVFKYLGDNRFIVERSLNSKLNVGDEFTCSIFIENEPLYLTDLHMNGVKSTVSYVCGRDNGVKVIMVDEDELDMTLV